MRRRLEALLPVLVLIGFAAGAVIMSLLLSSAQQRGVDALEDSIRAEVQAVSGSQDQRFTNTFTGTAGLASPQGEPYEMTVGSRADLAQLEQLLQLVRNLRSGFYLVDADGVITQGVQLLDAETIGSEFE